MIAKIAILPVLSFLLASCGPATGTQEIEIASEAPAATEAPATQDESPIDPPTETPTSTPLACVTLLTPENADHLPMDGKVTFSWSPMSEAGSYVLNIMLPTGETISFDTDQAFRDRYMEAFVDGGKYQWQVIVQGSDESRICASEVFTFDKPAYTKPSYGNKGGGGDGSGSDTGNGCTDPDGCGHNE